MTTEELLAEIDRLTAENKKFYNALRIIAGEVQCKDNLLGNADIARLVLQEAKL
jgi:hypothetical protein